MELLLLSNSTSDRGYLVDWLELIARLLPGGAEALFVPYAGVVSSWDSYEARVREALAPAGVRTRSIHHATNPVAAVHHADCILVGGGNTFHLLHHCRKAGILHALVRRVRDGARYVGWSAGANLACPTICTTNDMPVIDPHGFDALNLVRFQINPHFTDDRPPGHHGETRTQRLAEFTRLHPALPVLALPEGCYVRVSGESMSFGGDRSGWWFRDGAEPEEVSAGPIAVPS
jgi:dipeptidase E